jgi:hypothetical protein
MNKKPINKQKNQAVFSFCLKFQKLNFTSKTYQYFWFYVKTDRDRFSTPYLYFNPCLPLGHRPVLHSREHLKECTDVQKHSEINGERTQKEYKTFVRSLGRTIRTSVRFEPMLLSHFFHFSFPF